MARTRLHKAFYILIACLCFSTAQANDEINYKAIEKEGFTAVSDFLKTLTPEQRKKILEGAKEQQKNIKLTPKEQEAIKKQLLELQKTLDFEEIDRSQIDKSIKENIEKLPETVNEYKAKQKN